MESPQTLIYNGELVSSTHTPVSTANRAFRYGDSIFETIRVVNGEPMFFENHYSRLQAGMAVLKMVEPDAFSQEYFQNLMKMLVDRNGISGGGVVRLTLFRNTGGTYKPLDNSVSFLMETTKLDVNEFELNDGGLTVGVYEEASKPVTPFAMYKTGNSLLYVMASLYAAENTFDDCLLVNDKGSLLEATSSNLFIVSNGVLYTPALDEGCIAGTMRMKLINIAISNKIKVYECTLRPQDLLMADEMFLTNAIAGIKWVKSYKNKRYFNKTAKLLIQQLNDSFEKPVRPPVVDQSKLSAEHPNVNEDLIKD